MHTILLTGGAGFIGSHLTRLFVKKYPQYKFINLDKLTYAGNLENLRDIEKEPNYVFVKGDITDLELLRKLFAEYKFTAVLHCAAESHVDRSITDPLAFITTNVLGTASLLQAAKEAWAADFENKIFYHISTDEVYGSLGDTGFFTEQTAYDPRSPYSSSKASSDHIVRAFYHTYKMPVKISNCSNNYGPYHFPEKLIPLCIHNIINIQPIPYIFAFAVNGQRFIVDDIMNTKWYQFFGKMKGAVIIAAVTDLNRHFVGMIKCPYNMIG